MVSYRPGALSPELSAYLAEHTGPPDSVLTALAERTKALGRVAGMQIGADQGALMTLLTRLVGAKEAVEVGTFTGYSAICIARGLQAGGHLLCCDVSEDFTAIAKDAWAEAGLTDIIELRLGPAIETLRALPAEARIDLAFIDADKGGYADYYGELLPRIHAGGIVLADNTLQSGRVVDAEADDGTTVAIRSFNDLVAADDRVDSYILPVGDGLTLIRKR